MASTLASPAPIGLHRTGRPARRLTYGQHLVTVLLATWMMFGVFLDGWAHTNVIESIESFFTPWHAVFYSGFVATAGWISYLVLRGQTKGGMDLSLIPTGYGLAAIGVIIQGAGGVGDMIWHSIFGIEADTEALMNPTHLLLFAGSVLILTSPLRAAWHSDGAREQTYRSFFPVLLSMVLSTAMVAFFLMFLSPFTQWFPVAEFVRWAPTVHIDLVEMGQELGIASHVFTSLIFVTPLLVAMRRWRLPFGSATTLFTTVAIGISAVEGFEGAEKVMGAVIGGIAADLLIARLRPSDATWRFRVAAAALPVPMWLATFAIIHATWGLGWVVEFWAGTIVLSSLATLTVACLMTLPPSPTAGASEAAGGERYRRSVL